MLWKVFGYKPFDHYIELWIQRDGNMRCLLIRPTNARLTGMYGQFRGDKFVIGKFHFNFVYEGSRKIA